MQGRQRSRQVTSKEPRSRALACKGKVGKLLKRWEKDGNKERIAKSGRRPKTTQYPVKCPGKTVGTRSKERREGKRGKERERETHQSQSHLLASSHFCAASPLCHMQIAPSLPLMWTACSEESKNKARHPGALCKSGNGDRLQVPKRQENFFLPLSHWPIKSKNGLSS